MHKQQFAQRTLESLKSLTVLKTTTVAELAATYDEYLLQQRKGSPLQSDNKLSRQAFLTQLYETERTVAGLAGNKVAMKQVLAEITALKAEVRAFGVTQQSQASKVNQMWNASTLDTPVQVSPTDAVTVVKEDGTVEEYEGVRFDYVTPPEEKIVNVLTGETVATFDPQTSDGTNEFEALYS
jgi:hypothetical protein